MEKYGYPGFAEHKKGHEKLIGLVSTFVRRADEGDETVAPELLEFLKGWLGKHIVGVDAQYSEFLINKGIV